MKSFLTLLTAVALTGPLLCLAQTAPANSDLDQARRAYQQGDFPAALKQVTPLAERGDAAAQTLLGTMNLKGQGVAKDTAQALKWFRAAAEHGNAEGQFYAGSMLFMGAGVPHDSSEGLKWLQSSANQGNSDAQVLLGLIYFQGGGGVTRDVVKADMWFHLAAGRGDPLAPRQWEAAEKQMSAEQITQAKALASSWKAAAPVEIPKPADHKN